MLFPLPFSLQLSMATAAPVPKAPFPGQPSGPRRAAPPWSSPPPGGAAAAVAPLRPRSGSRVASPGSGRPRMEARVAQSAARLARQVRGRAGQGGTGQPGTAPHRPGQPRPGQPMGLRGAQVAGKPWERSLGTEIRAVPEPRAGRWPRGSGRSFWEGKVESRQRWSASRAAPVSPGTEGRAAALPPLPP